MVIKLCDRRFILYKRMRKFWFVRLFVFMLEGKWWCMMVKKNFWKFLIYFIFKMNEDNDIVIVGIGCMFFGVENFEEFWKVLVNGEDYV